VTIPISLLNIIIAPNPLAALTNPNASLGDTPDMSGLLLNLLSLIETILITAPLTYLVSEYLFGRKLTISQAFSGVSNRFTQIGCGVLLIGLVVGLLAVLISFLVIAFPPALILSGFLLHIIIATSALMFPVLTLENIGASAALSRAWSLGKRRFWAAFGVGVIAVLITILIGSVLGGIITVIITSAASTMSINVQFLVISIISDIIGIFVTPISPIAFTLIYYNIRSTTEGLGDLLSTAATTTNRPIDLASPPSSFRFDSHDWRNIAILSVIGLIVGLIGNSLIQQLIAQLAPGLR
jgi:MFS family permease